MDGVERDGLFCIGLGREVGSYCKYENEKLFLSRITSVYRCYRVKRTNNHIRAKIRGTESGAAIIMFQIHRCKKKKRYIYSHAAGEEQSLPGSFHRGHSIPLPDVRK